MQLLLEHLDVLLGLERAAHHVHERARAQIVLRGGGLARGLLRGEPRELLA